MELDKLKKLLGISIQDTSRDDILQFTIDNIKEIILNYCNLYEMPTGLLNTAYRMAIDLYRNENLGGEENPLGSISSISEGDTTVSFKGNDNEFKNSLLKNYKVQLNKYRKLVW